MTADNDLRPVIYVISDSLGETGELVVRAAASQFDSGKIELRRVPYVNDKATLERAIEEASGFRSLIAYTIVVPELKAYLEELARSRGLPTVDLLSSLIYGIQQVTSMTPRLEPGLIRRLDEQYYRKVEAIEFAVRYDDGKDPRGLMLADIVLIGVSRTSKTPVCMYLAHKRIKAANVPLVPEVAPPEELFQIPSSRIVGLTINPQLLNEIRQERLKSLGLNVDAHYAKLERIQQELGYAEAIMKRLGCAVIDVTNRAVEETASKVLQIYMKGEQYVSES
ncbi:MAG: kinase/pyrophosphorylase [Clostridia bacterium]|nr:kinase/pyrophosphorylase [Clostridia bacterium]